MLWTNQLLLSVFQSQALKLRLVVGLVARVNPVSTVFLAGNFVMHPALTVNVHVHVTAFRPLTILLR